MSNIIRLPGAGCRHFRRGRCAYEEDLNPGLHQEHACAVVRGWTNQLDEFHDRAEAMGLGEERAGELWRVRFGRMRPEMRACPGFAPGAGPYECAHLDDRVCLSALPPCQGRCRRFQPFSEQSTATPNPENHP
ncbi:MAG: hypothetical protein AB7D51_00930 [Desulfovibrionaceae bacterium]